jgi:hypothetical protein
MGLQALLLTSAHAFMLSCFHVTGLHVVPKAQSIRWGGASPISWLCCHENCWIVNVIMKVCFGWSFFFPPTNKTLSHSSLICLKNCEIWVFCSRFLFLVAQECVIMGRCSNLKCRANFLECFLHLLMEPYWLQI